MSRVVNITEAKAQLSRLIAEARSGKRVVIGQAGKPVAVLSAYEADPEPRTLGGWEGKVWMAEDFDDPLPDELQRHFEGRFTRRTTFPNSWNVTASRRWM